jgi:hypothetical protein
MIGIGVADGMAGNGPSETADSTRMALRSRFTKNAVGISAAFIKDGRYKSYLLNSIWYQRNWKMGNSGFYLYGRLGAFTWDFKDYWNFQERVGLGYQMKNFRISWSLTNFQKCFFGADYISVQEKRACINSDEPCDNPSDMWQLPVENYFWMSLELQVRITNWAAFGIETGVGNYYRHSLKMTRENAMLLGLNVDFSLY